MKVDIIEPSSYCFGVKRAIDLVTKICDENKGQNIYLFGELIHNKEAMKPLIDRGVKVLNFTKNTAESLLNSFHKNEIVVFSAHGHAKKYEEILLKNGVKFYDATCPIVNLNLQRIKDCKDEIIFVGKNEHPETMASLAAKDNVHLYDINNEFDYSVIKSGSVFVTNQTTLSFIELENIFKDIKKHIPSAKFSDEICNASRVRQEKVSSLDSKYDLVLIIGDKTSSNTTKLFDISSKNDSHATYFVSNLDEVKKTDLSKYHYCAIFSGTSCPKSLINTIKDYLEVTYGKI